MSVAGAVIAGGRSTRYGSPKALVQLGGERVIDLVTRALFEVCADVVAIINDPVLSAQVSLPQRADVLQDAGALAGVHAALLWAREHDHDGVLAVGCDMPFVPAGLLRALSAHFRNADVVVPESEGPRGVEPLCAYYGVTCIAAIERAVARGDARMIGFHGDVRVQRLPLADVRAFGDPAVLFRNLNTPADRDAAELVLRRGGT